MKKPSKQQIKDAVDKLKNKVEGPTEVDQPTARPQEKKGNKQRIRKKGV
jgi:hypothetical protein